MRDGRGPAVTLREQCGDIDIYLFDQLLRGNIRPGMRIFDAGCGYGRNLVYFIREGYEVFAVDQNPAAIAALRRMAGPAGNFRVEPVEAMSFPDSFADVVISSAVLHFARDEQHFQAMLRGTWRALKPGGLLFCRLASRIEGQPTDPSHTYHVTVPQLHSLTRELGGELADNLKTSVVHGLRCMTTWVVRKNATAL